jgi:outer membrane protein assembly factor BamB
MITRIVAEGHTAALGERRETTPWLDHLAQSETSFIMRTATLSISAACLLLTNIARAADWPQWRGPDRNGVITATRLPQKWPEKWPAPLWRSFVGEGYSSPVVVDGRVFIQGRPKEGQESCLCFDADNGKPLWSVTYPCAFQPPDRTAGRGPNSTPLVADNRVYMLGLHGMFHCLDVKSGRILWKHDFAQEYWGVEKDASGLDTWFPICGTAASPLMVGNLVVVPVGGKKAGTMVAFDPRTGKVVWNALTERSSYASPLLANLAGLRQLVGYTGLRMVGLDLASREVLWDFPVRAHIEQTIVSPVIWKDQVIIAGDVKPTVAVRISRDGSRVVQTEAWRSPHLRVYTVTPLVFNDHLVGLDAPSRRLVCLDLASGQKTWETARFGEFGSLLLAGDQILALNSDAELIVLKADPKSCTVVGRWQVSDAGGTWAHPAVTGSRIFIKDREHLLCFDPASQRASLD